MDFRIANTFTESLARLPGYEWMVSNVIDDFEDEAMKTFKE